MAASAVSVYSSKRTDRYESDYEEKPKKQRVQPKFKLPSVCDTKGPVCYRHQTHQPYSQPQRNKILYIYGDEYPGWVYAKYYCDSKQLWKNSASGMGFHLQNTYDEEYLKVLYPAPIFQIVEVFY